MINPAVAELIIKLEKVSAAAEIFNSANLNVNNPSNLSEPLETLCESIEQAAITARNTIENLRVNYNIAKPGAPVQPSISIAGTVSIIENNWLHIRLNTLLPHCRFQTPKYLSDTITRLLDNYAACVGILPRYERAMLIIDEHCNIKNRTVYDQDNKGWKAVSNVLKGRIFPDDDQFTLGIALVSTVSETPFCNIYIITADDTGDFFAMRSEGWLC